MKAYGVVEVYIHIFLTSALTGGEWSASRPGRFTPREKAPGTHLIIGCVGLITCLDDMEKRKSSNSDPSTVQRLASRFTVYARVDGCDFYCEGTRFKTESSPHLQTMFL
jgi:hypothetical protein